MKKLILLVVILLLIIPFVVSAKGDVNVKVTPHFYKDLIVILTDGDSVSYSFTITNIGNETIKDQKLWYNLITPSYGGYEQPSIDIPELKEGENTTLTPKGFSLSEVGAYCLTFGINSQGDKKLNNEVTVNGEINTLKSVQHSFNTCNRSHLLTEISAGLIVGVILILFKIKK